MIINCPCKKKQFKIDPTLIPSEGRDLQCGSCNHFWFYKIEKKKNEVLELSQEIISKDIEAKTENKDKKIEEKKLPEKIIKTKTNSKKLENKGRKIFSYLIVFIISFVALIILLDTLKTPLNNVFPGLEIVLFNLFETLQDIKLFIIDLI